MTLYFSHQWEHALVAAVVESAKGKCPSCQLGRTAIQKILYFLSVHQVPMRFKFRIHHFGPFCEDVANSLDWLQADSVVRDTSPTERYSNYVTGENWSELKENFDEPLKEHRETIELVVETLGSLDHRTLELIATLDYSFRWVHARGGNGPWKESAIEKFKQIKKDRFSDEEITEFYGKLVESNLIKN